MFTTHDRRGRHRQAARNLTLAVATAALAGGGAAVAADGGAAPAKTAQEQRDRQPLADSDPVVTQARARLERLVAEGAIDQAEADVVLHDVIAGSVEPDALVRSGKVASAHMPAINNALREVKEANAGAGDVKCGDVKQAKSPAGT